VYVRNWEKQTSERCRELRTLTDAVEKVAAEKLWSKNTQQSNRGEWIFESTLRIAPDLESILRTRMSKILFRQHRPKAALVSAAFTEVVRLPQMMAAIR
jgi:hypothetical protein